MCLQRLQELHLQQNSIEVLADQALVGLTSLALLDLSRNNLHTIGPASLRPLVSLQVLRITGETGCMHVIFYNLPVNISYFILYLQACYQKSLEICIIKCKI